MMGQRNGLCLLQMRETGHIRFHVLLHGPEDHFRVKADVEQLQVNMLDGEELEVKAVLTFRVIIWKEIQQELIQMTMTKILAFYLYKLSPFLPSYQRHEFVVLHILVSMLNMGYPIHQQHLNA